MERTGLCVKCGEKRQVRDHHINGYSESHKDEVVPYCRKCDTKAHNKARREGRCGLTHEEVDILSNRSYTRRSVKTISLSSITVGKNIQLREILHINKNTGNIALSSYFSSGYHTKLCVINEVPNG